MVVHYAGPWYKEVGSTRELLMFCPWKCSGPCGMGNLVQWVASLPRAGVGLSGLEGPLQPKPFPDSIKIEEEGGKKSRHRNEVTGK